MIMCQKRNSVELLIIHCHQLKKIRVDLCIRSFIKSITNSEYNTVACCCGHGKYPLTVVCKKDTDGYYDLISGIEIPRTRNFYRLDSEGYYYIPEVSNEIIYP
ncbi:MAG: hypothetical protein KAS32_13925 [Candidatus Peribacteraceae bacterium]|nr:hypothetical protein [Candidatus Peribacteraceae bacterium]